jgi:glycosyltransferase involved in cell wall biosynthesis
LGKLKAWAKEGLGMDTVITSIPRSNTPGSAELRYSALIRTFNSERTIEDTIRSLEAQTVPPQRYIVVDSGSTDSTLAKIPSNSTVIKFAGPKFNYSSAINQGIDSIPTKYVLIISSHTTLQRNSALQFALEQLESEPKIGAAYFCAEDSPALVGSEVSRETFTGFNGIWNTCGFFRTDLLRRRSFRPEVFSAEDQEWSRWLLENTDLTILRIAGAGFSYNNPSGHNLRKRLDEHEAIAMFTVPKMMTLAYIAKVGYRAVRPISSLQERQFNLNLFTRLLRRRVMRGF